MLIPFVNFIVGIILCIDLAKSFGKGAGFGIGLALLGVISFPFSGSAVRNIKALLRRLKSKGYKAGSASPSVAATGPNSVAAFR